MRLLSWLSVFLLLPSAVSAQIFVYGGTTLNTVRSQHLVGNVQPQVGYQVGAYLRAIDSPIAPFYLGVLVEIERNGYSQEIDNVNHLYRLTYITLTPFVSYSPVDRGGSSVREGWTGKNSPHKIVVDNH